METGATSIGTAALLVMILRMMHFVSASQVTIDSLLILGGGIWYMFFAILFYKLMPYRPAQRSLGECIHETAKYLRIKSELYNTKTDLDGEYKKLVAQQVVVNEKQEQVRELLFKNRELLKESIRSGRLLVLTFVDLIDLYEHIMASWYEYNTIRYKFSSTGILNEISELIKKIADELDNIGFAIQSNSAYKKKFDIISRLSELSLKIDSVNESHKNAFILKKVLVNLRNMSRRIDGLSNYFKGDVNPREKQSADYSKFVSHQKIDGTTFRNNLTLKSSVFRHSLRMMITCTAGYFISKLLPDGHHSYWVLLTIIVILKPGYSLTKQRNFERFTGTISGGLIGLLILAFVHDRTILFALIIIFMIGTYTFQRLNYVVMVIFLTPYVLMLFNLLGLGLVNVAEERLLDTAIGSLLSFLASYLLFPQWEINNLNNYMANVLKANINYMYKLSDFLCGKNNLSLDYKLIRKEVFLSTANLAGAFNRMLSEPKNKQQKGKEIYEFVVLNNVFSSNVASLIAAINGVKNEQDQKLALQYMKRSVYNLKQSLARLETNQHQENEKIKIADFTKKIEQKDDIELMEQLDFVYRLSAKINRLIYVIAN